MTQLDPRSPPTTTPSTPSISGPQVKAGPPFNWRVSVGMAIGLVVLFGVLFGLRALGIFPPRPTEDPEIAAVRATLAALPAQQPALAAQPTAAPTQPPAPATLGAIVLATPAPPAAAAAPATVAAVPTTVPAPAVAQPPATQTQRPSTVGTQFETAPTPVATTTSDPAIPRVAITPLSTVAPESTAPTSTASTSVQPTPVAVNLPADLANAILQGYTNYWTVRVNSMRDPTDASIDLRSVMGGSELVGAQQTLTQYRDAGEAFDSDVKHTIWITSATPDSAVIVDQFTASTLRVDPDTKAPLEATPRVESRTDTFALQRLDGTWKVVDEP